MIASPTATRSPSALICVTSLGPTSLLATAENASLRFTVPDFISQPPRPFGRAKYFSLWKLGVQKPSASEVQMTFASGKGFATSFGFYTFDVDGDLTNDHVFPLIAPLPLRKSVRAPKLPDDVLTKPIFFFYMPLSALGMQEGATHHV